MTPRGAVRVIGAADVTRLLPVADCIDALERALRDTDVRAFVGGVAFGDGKVHLKAAATTGDTPLFAAKINANFPDNPRRHDLPTIQGVLVLFEGKSGQPLAVMDSAAVTIIRTAAASGVAARHLAPADARHVAIVGCGAQALAQLDAMRAVRPIARVTAYDRDDATAERFVADAARAGGQVARVKTLADCTRDADIVVTCTTSKQAFLEPAHVRAGAFVAAVGADNPDKSEIAPALMAQSSVVVDDLDQCAASGDLHHAIAAGVMTKDDVRATLAGVVRDTSRFAPDGRTVVFDSTGIPIEDVIAAALVYERAGTRNVGTAVTLL